MHPCIRASIQGNVRRLMRLTLGEMDGRLAGYQCEGGAEADWSERVPHDRGG
jgi:uncharacterized protein YgfB (UPF0149 family)